VGAPSADVQLQINLDSAPTVYAGRFDVLWPKGLAESGVGVSCHGAFG
jgi:hypothetical protein